MPQPKSMFLLHLFWSFTLVFFADKAHSQSGFQSTLPAHAQTNPSNFVALDINDGRNQLALISGEELQIWDLHKGEQTMTLKGYKGKLAAVAFSPDGKSLATGSWDQIARVWDLETGRRKNSYTMHYGAVSAVAWNPTGTEVATGSWDQRVRLWNARNNGMLHHFVGHRGHISRLAYSPDGKLLASCGWDGLIIVYDMKENQRFKVLANEEGALLDIAFSPDGKFIASGDNKGNLKIWDVQSGKLIKTYPQKFVTNGNVQMEFGGQVLIEKSPSNINITWSSFWQADKYLNTLASIPGLTAKLQPKSQFETPYEYYLRLREGSNILAPLALAIEMEEDQRKRMRIMASRRAVVVAADELQFGTYDITKGIFPVELRRVEATIILDRENARTLFENRNSLRIEATEQLSDDLINNELLNVYVLHPITGYRHPVGEIVELEDVPVAASLPAKLEVSGTTFADDDGDNRLAAGERALLQLTVSNTGPGMAHMVRIVGDTDVDIKGLAATIGNLEPGAQHTISLTITGGEELTKGNAEIKLSILELNGFHADPITVIVPTLPFKAPQLAVADVGVQDAEGRATITPGTVVDVTLRVRNEGEGPAAEVKARITPGAGVFLAGTHNPMQAVLEVGSLGPGAFKDVTFQAFANSEAKSFPLKAEFTEVTGRYTSVKEDLDLSLYRPQRSMQELVVSARVLDEAKGNQGALMADIAHNIPQAAEVNTNAVAVIIGNRTYQAGTPQVAFALNDAMLMRRYVEQALGYRPGNVLYMEDATLTNMKVVFGDRNLYQGRLNDLVKPGLSDVFVFYSGHGAPDPNERRAYLMPVDADPTRLALTGYSLDVLYENLNKLGARSITVVIDACFSGSAGGGEMLIAQASPIGIRINDPSAILGERAVVVTASGGQQVASWYPEMRHGLLTYYFLKGLQGEADLTGNGEITAGEMNQWLNDEQHGLPYMARRLHSREQSPQVWGDKNLLIR